MMSQTSGLILLGIFGLVMLVVTWLASRAEVWGTRSGFLYAGRNVSGLMSAFSIAASWIWAPALFVSVQKSYELGLAGLFWFTAPNVLAVVIYCFLGPKIREQIPSGFSIPDWIRHRFNQQNPRLAGFAHKLYLVPYFWYQVMAVTVQIFVGGLIFNYLTGVQLEVAMIAILLIVLIYSLISGLRASIVTDTIQMVAILVGLAIIVPMFLNTAGIDLVRAGLAGAQGSTNVLDPGIAFSFGIVTAIGLLAGSISDQQFWQRVFAVKRDSLVGAFLLGGILFAVVPIGLSVLGFAAAAPGTPIEAPAGTGLPMIGIASVATFLPEWALIIFVVMLLCGLASTLDSGFAAAASLYAIDVRNSGGESQKDLAEERATTEAQTADQERNAKAKQKGIVRDSRIAMIGLAVVGLGVALLVKEIFPLDRLWWLFNGVATIFVVPTVLSIYWKGLSVVGVIAGIFVSLIGMAVFVYGNYIQNNDIVVWSALGILAANLFCCVVFSLGRKKGAAG